MKKTGKEQKLDKLVNELAKEHERHRHIMEHGASDPFWPDGANLNLVRNHVIYYRMQIKEFCEENEIDLPGVYYIPVPPKVDNCYMARLDQTERLKRIFTDRGKITTKKIEYDEQTSLL